MSETATATEEAETCQCCGASLPVGCYQYFELETVTGGEDVRYTLNLCRGCADALAKYTDLLKEAGGAP